KRYRQTGVLTMDLYAEGQVRLDTSAVVRDAPQAVLQLTTRGQFRLRTHQKPLARTALPGDPLVLQARRLGLGTPVPSGHRGTPGQGTKPASHSEPLPPLPNLGANSPPPALGIRPVAHQESGPARP